MYDPLRRDFVVDLTVSSTTDRVIMATLAVARFAWVTFKDGVKVLFGLSPV
jgi:hypothetical protein